MIDNAVEKMNRNIVEANTKLLDENKLLKEDKEMLKLRMNRAIKYILNHKENVAWIECFGNDLIDILEGRYFEEI